MAGPWIELDYYTIATPNLVAIGDSFCAGHPNHDPLPSKYPGVDPSPYTWQYHLNPWPYIRNNFIVNKGIGGETSLQIADRIQTDVIQHHPWLCFLPPSMNDTSYGVTLAQRTTAIQSSIHACTTEGIQICLPHGLRRPRDTSSYFTDWNTLYLPTISGQTLNCDWLTPLTGQSQTIAPIFMDDDTLHPNLDGYTRLGLTLSTPFF